ncbi:ribosomal L7Ae/L30e/S12e/Gadd45 family protein [Cohnella sp.]|uniref:ribosomal L7Ae/L30e/S12e/Gadd45 family protein n=1 Tax=Cohnella sp. TaxID=1883426 RepID=UPI003566E2E9
MTTSVMRLQGGHVRVGTKQTTKTVELDEAVHVFVAQDADPRMVNRIVQLCIQHDVKLTLVDTMRNLGKACGIGVGTAMAAVVEE